MARDFHNYVHDTAPKLRILDLHERFCKREAVDARATMAIAARTPHVTQGDADRNLPLILSNIEEHFRCVRLK